MLSSTTLQHNKHRIPNRLPHNTHPQMLFNLCSYLVKSVELVDSELEMRCVIDGRWSYSTECVHVARKTVQCENLGVCTQAATFACSLLFAGIYSWPAVVYFPEPLAG